MTHADIPHMTLARTLRSELQRLARSPLLVAHIACGIAGGVACGSYFAVSRWDPAMGADAFAQFLGALMPLMSGIACGLAIDEERAAGHLANLTALPSRSLAIMAKLAALLLMAALALGLAFSLFAAIIAAAGRLTLGPAPMILACTGVLAGSIPLYMLALALSLRFGRNAAIGVGAAGTLVAFFSVGGLAHGLMTGQLTGAMPSILAFVPWSWAARLGSLGIEGFIAAGRDASQAAAVGSAALGTAAACAALSLVAAAILIFWFSRFEDRHSDG